MISRCLNKKDSGYKNYGGRGIKVCDRWLNSFEEFLSDMGHAPSPKHSIDRIENDGNYEPGNCRWATWKAQSRNKRSNRFLMINGEAKCIAEWAEIYGIKYNILHRRISRGLPIEEAIKK